MYDNQDSYSKYLELIRKRYMRNGIIELGDLNVDQNVYELVAVLDNLESINQKLAIATDNNSSLQLLKQDYTTFYEMLRKKVVEEYNTLYDERIENLYTEVLNQVKIGDIEEDYRVVGKAVQPYVLPDAEEVKPVKLSPEELKEVKVLATIIDDEEATEETNEVEQGNVSGTLDFEDEEDFEDDFESEFEEDFEEDFEDDFEDEEEFEEEFEDEDSSLSGLLEDSGFDMSGLGSLDDLEEPELELPKNLKRNFSVGSEEPIRRSAFVPRTQNKGRFKGEIDRKLPEVPKRKSNVSEQPKIAPTVKKVVKKPEDLNARVYDKLDKFGGRLVDKLVGKKK